MPALVADFRQLRAGFMRDGLFKSSKAWYLWKMASTFAWLAGSVTVLLWAARESMLALVRHRTLRIPVFRQLMHMSSPRSFVMP